MKKQETIQKQKEVFAVFEKAGAVIVKAPSVAFEIKREGDYFYVFKSMFLAVNFSGVERTGDHIFLYQWLKIGSKLKKIYIATIATTFLKNTEIGFVQIK